VERQLGRRLLHRAGPTRIIAFAVRSLEKGWGRGSSRARVSSAARCTARYRALWWPRPTDVCLPPIPGHPRGMGLLGGDRVATIGGREIVVRGDVVLSMARVAIKSEADIPKIREKIAAMPAGQPFKASVLRAGQVIELTVATAPSPRRRRVARSLPDRARVAADGRTPGNPSRERGIDVPARPRCPADSGNTPGNCPYL
jgi:hypothetical protein